MTDKLRWNKIPYVSEGSGQMADTSWGRFTARWASASSRTFLTRLNNTLSKQVSKTMAEAITVAEDWYDKLEAAGAATKAVK